MLFNPLPTSDMLWNRLQEPSRPSRQPGDYLLLLSALDNGWSILEARRVFSWGRMWQEYFFILKLLNTTHLQTCEFAVKHTPQVATLLETQRVPVSDALNVHPH